MKVRATVPCRYEIELIPVCSSRGRGGFHGRVIENFRTVYKTRVWPKCEQAWIDAFTWCAGPARTRLSLAECEEQLPAWVQRQEFLRRYAP